MRLTWVESIISALAAYQSTENIDHWHVERKPLLRHWPVVLRRSLALRTVDGIKALE
jgi:hypothetical protein